MSTDLVFQQPPWLRPPAHFPQAPEFVNGECFFVADGQNPHRRRRQRHLRHSRRVHLRRFRQADSCVFFWVYACAAISASTSGATRSRLELCSPRIAPIQVGCRSSPCDFQQAGGSSLACDLSPRATPADVTDPVAEGCSSEEPTWEAFVFELVGKLCGSLAGRVTSLDP